MYSQRSIVRALFGPPGGPSFGTAFVQTWREKGRVWDRLGDGTTLPESTLDLQHSLRASRQPSGPMIMDPQDTATAFNTTTQYGTGPDSIPKSARGWRAPPQPINNASLPDGRAGSDARVPQ